MVWRSHFAAPWTWLTTATFAPVRLSTLIRSRVAAQTALDVKRWSDIFAVGRVIGCVLLWVVGCTAVAFPLWCSHMCIVRFSILTCLSRLCPSQQPEGSCWYFLGTEHTYKCLISSLFTYAIPIWFPNASTSSVQKLQRIQNSALCVSIGWSNSLFSASYLMHGSRMSTWYQKHTANLYLTLGLVSF